MYNIEKAIKTLEFDKIRELLASLAPIESAKSLALNLTPSNDIDVVLRRQRYTTDAKRLASLKGAPAFLGVTDIFDILEKADKSAVLSCKEILQVLTVLKCTRALLDYNLGERNFTTSLDEIFARLIPNKPTESLISRSILSEDMIADEASPELAEIRRKSRAQANKIRDILQRYTAGAYSKCLQENIVTIRNGRYVLPVKAEHRSEISGLVHDTSSSGATLFIEPMAVVEANNELRTLESREQHEIDRILSDLSARISDISASLRLNFRNITELAFYFTCAQLSYKMDATPPEINGKRTVNLVKARHPLLDPKKVVPISLSLGEDYRMLVITGPNTGGKTVTLKTLGLFSIMAQCGLHVPADEASICIFDRILPDIGDEQSIEQSLSTFSSHLVTIVSVVNNITPKTLVLFDELGAGTDPVEGAALAEAILEHVLTSGCLCAATTHYAELKAFALETEHVENASCEFDIDTLKPTYKLVIGTPGKSNAFSISKKLGLSDEIVTRATELVGDNNRSFEAVIEKLESTRIVLEREREEAAQLKADYESFKKRSEAELSRRLADAEKEAERAKAKAQQMITGAKAASDFVFAQLDEIKKKKDSEHFGEDLSAAKKALRAHLRNSADIYDPIEEAEDDNQPLPRPLKVGDEVMLRNIGTKAVVLDVPDKDGNLTVQAGIIKTKTNVKNISLLSAKSPAKSDAQTYKKNYRAQVSKDFKPSLDLRGMTGDDGWFMTDKYIDEANIAGVKSVTIIHGKGTGALRNALWERFRSDKRIRSFRPGQYGEGDYGVTVLELK
ncbi:MAG: endonuclease MutS2 [Clostridia bacterium]|nr:endonuclease MutS2 [Clostridia bacterium]